MAGLATSQDLINDALFRSGEIPGASEWDAIAVDYLNRAHRAICSGAFEFLPEYVTDWWWMHANGVLTMSPVVNAGTVDLVNGSTAVNFSIGPTDDMTGSRLKITDWRENYVIASHTAGAGAATLDSRFNGITNAAASYQLLKTNYNLGVAVSAIMSPIVGFRNNPQLYGLSPERMDELFPLSYLQAGIPYAFALESPNTIRFSHGGHLTDHMRMEFRYRPAITDLSNSPLSTPLIPSEHRHVLSDIVTMYIMIDKNDDRGTAIGTSARSTLAAMTKENTKRQAKMDQYAGFIIPRQSGRRREPLRTESGLIIG